VHQPWQTVASPSEINRHQTPPPLYGRWQSGPGVLGSGDDERSSRDSVNPAFTSVSFGTRIAGIA